MIVIGLIGGIGSGKSTVARMLSSLGAVLIDADKVGHEAYLPHTETWQQVVDAFGTHILGPDETIDRAKLGGIVFKDPDALSRLNGIVHPQMHRMLGDRLEALRREGAEVVVLEAAILIEANWTDLVDRIWVVVAPESNVIERLGMLGVGEKQVRARMSAQMPTEERVKHADVVIHNDGDLASLSARIEELWQGLSEQSG
ncbi:dephospho-CoA kinase [Chloroflexota bacterium]